MMRRLIARNASLNKVIADRVGVAAGKPLRAVEVEPVTELIDFRAERSESADE